jgi:hypothetical protein
MNRFRITAILFWILALSVTLPSWVSADNQRVKTGKGTRDVSMSKEPQPKTIITPYGEELTMPSYIHVPDFDNNEWLRQRNAGNYNLALQFYDFVRKQPLIGMSKEKVIEILGKPDSNKYVSERFSDSIVYRLCSSDTNNPYADIQFKDGKVFRNRIVDLLDKGWITENFGAKPVLNRK